MPIIDLSIGSGLASSLDRPPRVLESIPSFEPEVQPRIFGGNFEELFHGEFSEFVEAQPIIDTIAPSCPTNLSCTVNTKNRTMFFSWYWPTTYSSDGSIQNDIKEFEFFRLENGEHFLLTKIRIPKYSFYVNDALIEKSKNEGLMFAVRAIDYHDLTSEYSKIILVKLNKDFGCKEKEISPIFISNECGKAFNKKYVLNKKIIINKDQIKLLIGSHIAIKEPFISRNNTLLLTIKDLNTGKIFEISLTVENTQQINRDVVYSPTFNKTLDILASIRSGRTRF